MTGETSESKTETIDVIINKESEKINVGSMQFELEVTPDKYMWEKESFSRSTGVTSKHAGVINRETMSIFKLYTFDIKTSMSSTFSATQLEGFCEINENPKASNVQI